MTLKLPKSSRLFSSMRVINRSSSCSVYRQALRWKISLFRYSFVKIVWDKRGKASAEDNELKNNEHDTPGLMHESILLRTNKWNPYLMTGRRVLSILKKGFRLKNKESDLSNFTLSLRKVFIMHCTTYNYTSLPSKFWVSHTIEIERIPSSKNLHGWMSVRSFVIAILPPRLILLYN